MNYLQVDGRWYVELDGERLPVMAGGDMSSDTEVKAEPKSAEQIELEKLSLQEAKQRRRSSLIETALSNPQLALTRPELLLGEEGAAELFSGPGAEDIKAQLQLVQDRFTRSQELENIVTKNIRARLLGEQFLSPEQTKLVDDLFKSRQAEGLESLRLVGDQLAGSRGLRPSDTPIAAEIARQGKFLELGLQSAKASAALDLGQREQIFNEGLRQFQEGLRQQALQNRFALLGTMTTPVAGIGALNQGRMSYTQSGSTFNPYQLIGAVGGLAQGVGTAYAGFSGGGKTES